VADTLIAAGVAARNRVPLLALLSANAVSLVGSMTMAVALPWFVLETTGSPARAGISGFFVALPRFMAGIAGGALVDRLGFKRSSVLADLVSCVGIGLVPLLYQTVGLAFWQLLVCVFIGGPLDVPGLTARRALLPELGTLAGMKIEQVSAAFEANQNIGLLLGPPLAGLLVAAFGPSNVLWIDAASFLISAAVIGVAVPGAVREAGSAVRRRYLDDLAAGWRFLTGNRLLRTLMLSLVPMNFLGAPYFAVMLPVFARETYGSPTSLGLMTGAIGAGQLAGTFLYGMVGHRFSRRSVWIVGYLISPIEFWVLLLEPSLPVIVGVLAFSGLMVGPLNPLLVAVRLERIPTELGGRVFSTFSAVATGFQPLGMVLVGSVTGAFGLRPAVIVAALIAQLVGVMMLCLPVLRGMDAPVPGDPSSVAAQ
jgi:MFS family permease